MTKEEAIKKLKNLIRSPWTDVEEASLYKYLIEMLEKIDA